MANETKPRDEPGHDGQPGLQRFLARMYDDIYQELVGDRAGGDA